MNNINNKISNILTEYRVKNELSRKHIAHLLNVKPSYITMLEKGSVVHIDPILIKLITKVVGMSTIDLYLEFGFIDREYEINIGAIPRKKLNNSQRQEFERGKAEGFKLAKSKFAEKLLSLKY